MIESGLGAFDAKRLATTTERRRAYSNFMELFGQVEHAATSDPGGSAPSTFNAMASLIDLGYKISSSPTSDMMSVALARSAEIGFLEALKSQGGSSAESFIVGGIDQYISDVRKAVKADNEYIARAQSFNDVVADLSDSDAYIFIDIASRTGERDSWNWLKSKRPDLYQKAWKPEILTLFGEPTSK